MKKFLYTVLLGALGFLPYSCDLETSPSDRIDGEIVFNDVAGADKVLNGTWAYLMDTYTTFQNPGWSCLLLTSDAMGNDVAVNTAKYGYAAHYRFDNINQTNTSTVSAVWTLAYKAINNYNNVIAKVDEISGDSIDKKRIKAQAYASRAYLYLNLASFYSFSYLKDPNALCVPIYTEPSNNTTQGKKRSTVGEVYGQAISDLEQAYSMIGDYDRDGEKYKVDKNVIAGLLARAYLQTGVWNKAQQFADIAQQPYPYMSKTDYLSGFNDLSNEEWIWGHGQIPSQNTAGSSFDFKDVSSDVANYYSFMADPYFQNLFDSIDIRHQLFELDTKRFIGGVMYKKFKFRSDNTADIALMRKAEMILIEAESNAELGNLTEATTMLNELRTARGANTPDLTALSKEELIEDILIERRKELFGEGFALSDIIRRQKSVVRKEVPADSTVTVGSKKILVRGHTVLRFQNGTPFVANSPFYLFSIPVTETTNNPNL